MLIDWIELSTCALLFYLIFARLNLAFETNWLGVTACRWLWIDCWAHVSHECNDISIGRQKWFGSCQVHGIRYVHKLHHFCAIFKPCSFFFLDLALVHDLAESIVGDITPYCGVSKEDKKQREMDAMREIAKLIAPRGEHLMELFEVIVYLCTCKSNWYWNFSSGNGIGMSETYHH